MLVPSHEPEKENVVAATCSTNEKESLKDLESATGVDSQCVMDSFCCSKVFRIDRMKMYQSVCGICRSAEESPKTEILLGSEGFRHYSVFFLVAYPVQFVCFLIMYAASEPSFLDMSKKWQVWLPYVYLASLIAVLLAWGTYKTVRLAVRYASVLFYLGIYHHVFYILDNLSHFVDIFGNIVAQINDISDMFNTQKYWIVVGIIVGALSIIALFAIGPPGLLAGIPIIMAIYLFWAIIFFVMLTLPFSIYLYQIVIFILCPPWTLYDTCTSIHKVCRG
jgi:hypothetical protein